LVGLVKSILDIISRRGQAEMTLYDFVDVVY